MHKEIERLIHERLGDKPLVCLMLRGSEAHGTTTGDTDDLDMIGAYSMSHDHYLSLSRGNTIEIKEGKYDIVLYEITFLIDMLSKGNPNVFPMLYTPAMLTTPAWEYILTNKLAFNTMGVFNAFMGFAGSESKRMRSSLPTNHAYMGAKRRELCERFGYDVKHASHCIRLRRMILEWIQSGVMIVNRTWKDAHELVAIKNGEWEIERVESVAKMLDDMAHAMIKQTSYPRAMDKQAVMLLKAQAVRRMLEGRNGSID